MVGRVPRGSQKDLYIEWDSIRRWIVEPTMREKAAAGSAKLPLVQAIEAIRGPFLSREELALPLSSFFLLGNAL